jgi:antitoxin (DNA-binding transcriptional repressor) of toxin-antitoxin stability system
MRTIGVRELKANLSRVLREVQGGESVLVTDRGRVVAELRLPDPSGWGRAGPYGPLARMAASGHLRLGEPAPDPYPVSPLRAPAGMARELLDEERGER